MKRIQIKKLEMYRRVHKLLVDVPAPIIARMPQMASAIATLGNNIISIAAEAQIQIRNTKGATEAKNILRAEATSIAINIVAKVRSYATDTENYKLLQEVKFTKAGLNKLSGQTFISNLNILHIEASQNLAGLAIYGVDATTLAQLATARDKFAKALYNPRKNSKIRKLATSRLKDVYTATDALFTKRLNIYIGIIQDTEPKLYEEYQLNRKVKKPIRKTLAILCTVKDENNNPIPGVKVTVEESTRTFKTKKKGGFYTKSFPKGIHLFTFYRIGYQTQTIPVIINKGSKTDINIVLSQSEET